MLSPVGWTWTPLAFSAFWSTVVHAGDWASGVRVLQEPRRLLNTHLTLQGTLNTKLTFLNPISLLYNSDSYLISSGELAGNELVYAEHLTKVAQRKSKTNKIRRAPFSTYQGVYALAKLWHNLLCSRTSSNLLLWHPVQREFFPAITSQYLT